MADWLESLRKLQGFDGELFRLRNEQQQKPLVLEQARQRVVEQEARAKASEAHSNSLQLKHKEKELELATREANVKKLQMQLFQVKTNKEYAAMQREIDQSKADISLIEEEILRLLEEIDHAKQEHHAQLAQVAQHQQALRTEEERIARDLAAIEQQIASLEQQRQALTPSVEPAMLSTYERVLANREGLALVPLVDSSCGGCHMVQPPQVVNEVYLKAKLTSCESCSRILYVDAARP